jgi:hypothetical protein
MAARACDSHYVVEEQARVLCWDYMRCDEEVAVVGANRSPPQARTRMERAMGCGCAPIAFGTETEKVLDRMRDIETTEPVMEHAIAVGTRVQEIQLASVIAVGRKVRETALESMPGRPREVLARRRESTVDSLTVVPVKLLVHTAGSSNGALPTLRQDAGSKSVVVLAHKTDMGHVVVPVVPETVLYTDRGTAVVVVQEILPCGCSAAQVAQARQPEYDVVDF